MPKLVRTLLFSIFILVIPSSAVAGGGFVYPFDKISATSCKWNPWSSLNDDCKVDLPRISGANYSQFEKNQLYRRVYTVLWGATYDYGWDVGFGSHLGVDIATSAGTPVRSVGDGNVVYANWSNGWGNVVTVKHTLSDGTVIYSNYAHLSKILVKNGEVVLAGQNVGEVGNTGNSYGNHLHFQIDVTNQAHPYYYVTCGRGLDPLSVVNKGLCQDFLKLNTIDPIAFLESGKVAIPGEATRADIEAVKNRPVEKVDRSKMKTRAEIQQEEIQEFLKSNNISINLSGKGTNVMVWSSVWSSVTSGNVQGKATRGNFPEAGLDLVYDTSALSVFPEKIVALENGKRNFKITAKKTGAFEIAFKMGQTVIAKRTVVVLSKADSEKPATAEIRAPGSIALGESKNVLVVMKTKYGTPLLDSPFEGRYVLRVLKGKAKFCNASKNEAQNCRTEKLSDELEFTYADTYRGALQAQIRPFAYAPISLQLVRIDLLNKPSVARLNRDISVTAPRGLDNTYAYYAENVSALQKGWFPTRDGYLLQNRELVGSGAKELIRRYLGYRWLKAGNDYAKKKAIGADIVRFERDFGKTDDFARITRGQLAGLVFEYRRESLSISGGTPFVDEWWAWRDVVATLRVRYGFAWKDQFWARYFQPEKTVTVGEALYLVEKIGY